jgi:hypothetical protein
VVAQQELQRHRGRELRGAAEAGVGRVELARQGADRPGQRIASQRAGGQGARGLQVPADLLGSLAHVVTAVAPGVAQRLEDLPEAGAALPRPVGEIGAGEERHPVVVEHAGHRPAAVPGNRLGGVHVDRVDVRAPSRGTSGRPRSPRSSAPAGCVAGPPRTPPPPTPTSRPGSPHAQADTGSSNSRGDSPCSQPVMHPHREVGPGCSSKFESEPRAARVGQGDVPEPAQPTGDR